MKLASLNLGLSVDNFQGQVAVVTGAGRGIGRETARAFARLGARVVIAELSEEGEETRRLIAADGGEALFVRTDVSNPAQVDELAQRTRAAFGPADILVNNAILCPASPVVDMEVDLWDRVMAVNLRGTFLTCKAFLPDMLDCRQGVIINMISTEAMPLLSAYMASKQGIAAFSQSLAAEIGECGVRVIAFAPGFVDTPGLRAVAEKLAPHMGLSSEQFLKLPLHPAYSEQAMPPEHAGAAAAYLAAALADVYHGEQVTAYTVLERAGFITAAQPAVAAQPADAAQPEDLAGGQVVSPAGEMGGDREAARQEALNRVERLREVIGETEAEFGKLPVFVRPMARAGFKKKSGMSLQDWSQALSRLGAQLQPGRGATAGPGFEYPQWRQSLEKLGVYYAETPAETARFTKDEQVLGEVRRVAAERLALIRALIEALGALSGGEG